MQYLASGGGFFSFFKSERALILSFASSFWIKFFLFPEFFLQALPKIYGKNIKIAKRLKAAPTAKEV